MLSEFIFYHFKSHMSVTMTDYDTYITNCLHIIRVHLVKLHFEP